MIIELGDFFSSQKSSFPLDLCFSPEDGADATGMIPADLIIKENGIVLKGEIRSVGDYLSLVSAVTVKYGALCDRCLEPFDAEMTFEFDRQIVASQKRGDAREDEEEEPLAVEEGKIDLTEPLSEAIALEAPTVHLCREDCPGLCPTCGKKRDDPTCKCSEKKEIDPRFEILKKLLDNSSEV
ncbi:MAG: DUF177 domain-containing protein [Clostridia bacterium]|nr:DUF177 domain-containing protein [Clostridia bacterium]